MKASFRRRVFLNPASTDQSSYILVHVDSTNNGEYPWGTNMVNIADCQRKIELEFFIGTRTARRISLAKINLLIKVLTAFRDALLKEITLVEKTK
jgi:hypothetical protein